MTGLWFAMNPIGRREDSLFSRLMLISLRKRTTPEADSTSTSRWVNIREEVYWSPSPNLSHCHERPQAFPTLGPAVEPSHDERLWPRPRGHQTVITAPPFTTHPSLNINKQLAINI